ncbi:MAG: SRPBCC family protein, partial [Planctomycetaceae bacterium]
MPKFNVSRSIQINASRKKVFDAVADFGTWTAWSPWLCAEPGAKVTVSSDASSVGSLYSWNGEVVGVGEIEHKRMVPEERIEDEIRFLKPWKAVSQVTFTLSEVADGTELTWTMAGSVPWFLFFMKPMMKTMIGMDYDRGLKMLKEWLETGSVSASTEIKGVES